MQTTADPKLMNIIEEGDYNKILKYINTTPNLNCYGNDSRACSLLYWCIFHNKNINIIRALVHSKGNFYFPNFEGKTPLMMAAQENRLEIVKLLLKKNIHFLNEVDSENRNALYYSVHYSDNFKITYFLLKKAINKNIQDSYGQTPLDVSFTKQKSLGTTKTYKSYLVLKGFESRILSRELSKSLTKKDGIVVKRTKI